jgi:hypothetical protein
MAADAVYDAIKTYLTANQSSLTDPDTSDAVTIRFENESFDLPNPPKPFVSVALTSSVYGQQTIGASLQAQNRWDERGHLWLAVFAQTGSGVSRARHLAKQLADLFRGTTLLSGSLEFMDSFIGEGEPGAEDGNWYKLPLAIEWRRMDA